MEVHKKVEEKFHLGFPSHSANHHQTEWWWNGGQPWNFAEDEPSGVKIGQSKHFFCLALQNYLHHYITGTWHILCIHLPLIQQSILVSLEPFPWCMGHEDASSSQDTTHIQSCSNSDLNEPNSLDGRHWENMHTGVWVGIEPPPCHILQDKVCRSKCGKGITRVLLNTK